VPPADVDVDVVPIGDDVTAPPESFDVHADAEMEHSTTAVAVTRRQRR
jgi:hypothetical protein